MEGNVIKSFLISLGFEIDDSTLSSFNSAIAGATKRVTILAASVVGATAAIVKGVTSISEGFEDMGYSLRIIQPALNKALVLRREMLKAYGAAGINVIKTIQESVKLNFSLAKTKFALEAIYKSAGSKLFGLLTKQSDIFRGFIYKNMPKIIKFIEVFAKVTLKAFDFIIQLGSRLFSILGRVYGLFVDLDKATGGWSTKVLAVAAAFAILGPALLANPLTWLLATLTAILLLFDDFATYQEGGKSLIDWSKFKKLTDTLGDVGDIFKSIFTTVVALGKAIYDIVTINDTGLLHDLIVIKEAFESINETTDKIVRRFGGGLVNKALDARNRAETAMVDFLRDRATTGGFGSLQPVNPVSSNVQNSQSNYIVKQQTSINVSGSPNAAQTGFSVAGEQGRVNMDLLRYMKRYAQ